MVYHEGKLAAEVYLDDPLLHLREEDQPPFRPLARCGKSCQVLMSRRYKSVSVVKYMKIFFSSSGNDRSNDQEPAGMNFRSRSNNPATVLSRTCIPHVTTLRKFQLCPVTRP